MVDSNLATASSHICDSNRILALTRAPCFTNGIKGGLTLLVWQRSAQIKQVNTVKLDIVVGVKVVILALQRHNCAILVISLLGKVGS